MASAKDIANRVPITVCLMMAAVMYSLDSTIANVALPHMQGSISASQDQITWVLTSYIVATAIMTPLTGWLSVKLGRKLIFLVSIVGFTIASMLCGIATSLPEIVLFRLVQGACGASLIPLSQATVLDIYPPRMIGQVMAIWGMGAILGPILGPALGGWLTDNLSWRWVFYINLPVGILAALGVFTFMDDDQGGQTRPFDFLGFGALTVFIASMQLMLDRGPEADWFTSREIWTYAIAGGTAFWVFMIQTLSAKHPFFHRDLALDRNFVVATVFGFFVGLFLFATMALLPPMLQNLMGYPVLDSGLVTMPRGVGSLVAMFVVGQAISRVDTRILLTVGLILNAWAMWMMTHWSLDTSAMEVVWVGFAQGVGVGLLFTPLSVTAFSTLAGEHRPEGAAVYTLTRNLGSSIGISVMQALWTSNSAVVHSTSAEMLQPNRPEVRALPSVFNPHTAAGVQALNGEVTRQASMVGFIDDFKLMFFMTLAVMPLVVLMRSARSPSSEVASAAVE
ncbi:MAG TPA: MDR family MFS transporter [Caulobacteraceae bacterium]|nr:MDR family MFS transporter [Caulobacteraceae bacterium]